MEGLEKLTLEGNPATKRMAFLLVNCVAQGTFVICLCIISHCSVVIEPVANFLQAKQLSILDVTKYLKHALKLLNSSRETAETSFKSIFDEAKVISDKLGFELKLPRLIGLIGHKYSIAKVAG